MNMSLANSMHSKDYFDSFSVCKLMAQIFIKCFKHIKNVSDVYEIFPITHLHPDFFYKHSPTGLVY